ncbi:hypothetical protein OD350_10145 [Clostridium beijerinckii]|nr:hypothetical protein OD350_10145 [Clostridium beijerinckii]
MTHTVIFLGYILSDPDINLILQNIRIHRVQHVLII